MIFSKNLTNIFRGEHERDSLFSPLEIVGNGLNSSLLVFFSFIFLGSKFFDLASLNSSLTTILKSFVGLTPILFFFFLTPEKKRRNWNLIFFVFLAFLRIFLYSFVYNLKNSWFVFLGSTKNFDNIKFFFLGNVFRFFFCLGFLLYSKEHIKKTFCSFKENPSKFLIFIIFIGSFYYFFAFKGFFFSKFKTKLSNEEDLPSNEESLRALYNQGSLFFKWFFIFSVILIAPLYEEIIYRFIIVKIFGKNFLFLAFLFSFFSFGLAHVQQDDIEKIVNNDWSFCSIKSVLIYFQSGIFFFSVFYYGNFLLVYPVLLHSLVNFIAIHSNYLVTEF